MSAVIAASVTTAQILLGCAMACATFRILWGPRAQDRVVGFDNLYVTDGAFMPTSGGANPTLTIEANSFRVADKIGGRL